MPQASYSRRTVLSSLGLGGATVLVAGTGVLSYRALDTAVLSPSSGAAYDPWQEWRNAPGPLGAVTAAVLAANPHNTQPWVFTLRDAAIDVNIDDSRNIGTVDPFRREQHVGLGCALENLALALRARGLEPTIRLLPNGPDAFRVAHATFVPTAPQVSPLYDAIGTRHTNRGPYAARAVPVETLAALAGSDSPSGVAVHWVTEPAKMATLGALLVAAADALTRDEQQSRDSFAWFRANNDELQRHRDGMTLDPQGMTPLILSIVKLLPASSRTAGDAFWVTQTRDVHIKTAAAYGVLTAADPNDRATQLECGRLLQRIHLSATSRGIALQHMNQITERMDREKATGATATFAPQFAALLPPDEHPLVTFRVGYPTREPLPSPRREVQDVTH